MIDQLAGPTIIFSSLTFLQKLFHRLFHHANGVVQVFASLHSNGIFG